MCKAKPGLRCSHHAKEELNKAKKMLRKAQEERNPGKIQNAQKRLSKATLIWNSTPEGQKSLKNKLNTPMSEEQKKRTQQLLEQGQRMRDSQKNQKSAPKKNKPQQTPVSFSPEVLERVERTKEEFHQLISGFSEQDRSFMVKAMNYADTMHQGQKRIEGTTKIPYIIHPLEVTNYLLKIGVKDKNTIAVSLLHDTVEDSSHRIVEAKDKTVAERMKLASKELSREFNPIVGEGVMDLSNPPLPKGMEIREKRKAYQSHARDVLVKKKGNHLVSTVKFSDFNNNAGRIDPKYKAKAAHFYAKYHPLVGIFEDSFTQNEKQMDKGVLKNLRRDLNKVKNHLSETQKEIFT